MLLLTDCLDPWHNLALEELLFDVHKDGVLLYLWQNQNTVVIGRNQNAWKECRISLLEGEGGKLARRTSGGGAVFHDVGNLNFTFITDKKSYDQTRQLQLIIDAAESLGIPASFTGRNDIVCGNGAKFSGNAFRHSQSADLHHGTIIIDVDMQKLSRYLAPSREKLQSKGVDSVRARVCNLREYRDDLDVSMMKNALIQAFEKNYGAYRILTEDSLDAAALEALCKKHAGWEWQCGASPRFDASFSHRFPWGEIEFQLELKNGVIENALVFSDAMDEAFIRLLAPALKGSSYTPESVENAIGSLGGEMSRELAQWLSDCVKA